MGLYSFGIDYKMFDIPHPTFQDFNEIMYLLMNPPAWILMTNISEIRYVPFFKRTRAVLNRLHVHFDSIISSKRTPFHGSDVVSQILRKKALAEERGEPFLYTYKDIKDDMLSLFFAGHETTGSAICIIIYYMCIYPEWQLTIRYELKSFLKSLWESEEITAPFSEEVSLAKYLKTASTSAIQESLPSLGAFIAEAIRLIPGLALSFIRVATKSDLQLGPYKIPKNQQILFDYYSSNRSPEFDCSGNYNTKEFHPQRFFLQDAPPISLNKALLNNMANFGFGPHTCLGNTFALLQLHIVILFLICHYSFRLPDGSPHAERLILRSRTSIFSPLDLQVQVTPIENDC
jgi:cytochrome P450